MQPVPSPGAVNATVGTPTSLQEQNGHPGYTEGELEAQKSAFVRWEMWLPLAQTYGVTQVQMQGWVLNPGLV